MSKFSVLSGEVSESEEESWEVKENEEETVKKWT